MLGEELASYGPNVVVAAPAELAAAVRRRLKAAADFAASPAPAVAFPDTVPAKRPRKRTSEDQLKRMLQLVPFLVHNQGLHISEVASSFGVTRKELEDDLRILICSGLPEGYPDDLLDIQWEDDHVFITQDLDLNRPVRFTVDEACALLTGLETLNGLPELAEGSALESVTVKLMAAAGEEGLKAAPLPDPRWARRIPRTLRRSGRPSRTAGSCTSPTSPRSATPCPSGTSTRCGSTPLDNTWYFEAYCHSAHGLRNFRLDRIEGLEPNGRPVTEAARPAEGFPVKLFTPNDDDTLVTVRTGAAGHRPRRRLLRRADGTASERRAHCRDQVRQHRLAADVCCPAWRRRPYPGAGGAWPTPRRNGSARHWPATAARLLSMPWWSWILIWIALVAVSLLFYVLLGIRLFRQFMATMKDLGAAGERFGAPLADITDPAPQPGTAPEGQRAVPGSAVFASPMQMRHDYLTSKSSRREERRRRRVQRKADRGQPQALRDIEFS